MESPDVQEKRRALRQSFDPRVERTRAVILSAVRTLADQDQELTVSAIGRTAGVSRATFYSHYGSLDGLARALWQDAFIGIDDLFRFDIHTTPDAVRLAHQRLVRYFADHRSLYTAVAGLPISKASYLASVRAWAAVIEESLMDHPRMPSWMQAATVARFIASSVYGVLDAWVVGEIVLSEEDLVDHIVALFPTWPSEGA